MEVNGKVAKVEQLMLNSQQISRSTGEAEISIYKGELTPLCIIDNVKKLKSAFPQLPIGFYDILNDRLKDTGFSDQRLNDAINNLIDTCVYPTPTIANIISFDKRMKLHTYEEISELSYKSGGGVFQHYFRVEIGDEPYWISKRDADQCGVKYETK